MKFFQNKQFSPVSLSVQTIFPVASSCRHLFSSCLKQFIWDFLLLKTFFSRFLISPLQKNNGTSRMTLEW